MSSQNSHISQHPDDFDNYDDTSCLDDLGLDEESDRIITPTTRELLTLKLYGRQFKPRISMMV